MDNYETVSYIINDKSKEPSLDAVWISDFINNSVSGNTSIRVTSRERNNNIDREESRFRRFEFRNSIRLFTSFAKDKYLKNPTGKIKEKISHLLKKTGGHPLSIEIIARNITAEEIDEISNTLGVKEINRNEPIKRLQSLNDCFSYTINRFDSDLRELLPKLTLFKSPFPISATVEIFNGLNRQHIINLYNRSLLLRIESDEFFGKILEPEYWLYVSSSNKELFRRHHKN